MRSSISVALSSLSDNMYRCLLTVHGSSRTPATPAANRFKKKKKKTEKKILPLLPDTLLSPFEQLQTTKVQEKHTFSFQKRRCG